MVPFEHVLGWTYNTLIMWWLMAIFFMSISSSLGIIIDRGWKPYVLSISGGFLFYWWLSWLFWGKPIWHIAEKLNQTL